MNDETLQGLFERAEDRELVRSLPQRNSSVVPIRARDHVLGRYLR